MSGWRKRTIMDMAREAGWTSYDSQDERFEAFAKLVREDEREACAKLCDDHCCWTPRMIGETIRARGQA